jgi:hypothetical protein
MSRPLRVPIPSGVVYQFYRADAASAGASHDIEFPAEPKPGDKGQPVTRGEHWLKPIVFDSLTGGELSPVLGIRTYGSEDSAIAALRNAGGR